ncbi:metal ABC transporter permease [Winkia neuii]|uniref:metal ABC transporter permease n=1 Tax=Winkia neuii TaxID=33007 RepID=UPI0023A9F963|nr:metal ABC transporter permease [Winkia neuii]WEB71845.1 metal ABC transporter permease [Winkia neuii]
MLAEFLETMRAALAPIPGWGFICSAPYLFRPFCLLVVLAVAAGIVGTVVNLRCAEFNAEALVHGVFPGIVAGAIYGGINMILPGAAICAIFVVLALVWAGSKAEIGEGATATVLTTFFALGVVLSLKKGDMSGQLESLMFGRLLDVTQVRLEQSLLACLVAILLVGITWKSQIIVAFDRASASVLRINTFVIDLFLNVAIAAVVVSAASAVGVLLVIGFLVIPGAVGRLLARSASSMVPIGIIAGLLAAYVGLVVLSLPSTHPVSPQGAVSLSLCATFVVALAIRFGCNAAGMANLLKIGRK